MPVTPAVGSTAKPRANGGLRGPGFSWPKTEESDFGLPGGYKPDVNGCDSQPTVLD